MFEKKNISKLLYCLRALMHHVGFGLDAETNVSFSSMLVLCDYF